MGITGYLTFRESSGRLYVKWTIKYNWNIFPHLFLKSPHFLLCNSVWYLELEQIASTLFMRLRKMDSAAAKDLTVITRIQTGGIPVTYAMGVKTHRGYETVTCDHTFPIKRKTFYKGDWCTFDEKFNFRKSSEYMDSDDSVTVYCRFLLDPHSGTKESPSQIRSNDGASSSVRCEDFHLSESTITLSEDVKDLQYLSKSTMTSSEDFKDLCLSKSTMTSCEDFKDVCFDKGSANLSKNFKELYLSQSFTDITIKVKSKEFHVHKVVLVARSTVFASMFKYEMAEKNSGLVEITHCDENSFEDFVLFLYSGKLNIVSDRNAVNLYETADKYDVKELKDECLRCMVEEMTVDTFCDVVRLAVMHNEATLLSAATNFFVHNLRPILTTTKWHTFLEKNPSMGNELYLKAVKIEDS